MLYCTWCLGLLLCALIPQEATVKSELAKLQGDWKIVSGTLPEEFMRKTTLTFREDRLIFTADSTRTELRFRLHLERQPYEIDLFKGERKSPGIYDVREDQLRLCYEVDGRAVRPHRFEAVSGTEVLLILKRKK